MMFLVYIAAASRLLSDLMIPLSLSPLPYFFALSLLTLVHEQSVIVADR